MLCKSLPEAVTAQGGASQEASSRRGGREKDTSPGRLWVGAVSVGHEEPEQSDGEARWRGRGRAEQERCRGVPELQGE